MIDPVVNEEATPMNPPKSDALQEIAAPLSEDQALAFTQGHRRAVVRELTRNCALPSDADERKLLLAALDGMDRTTLTVKRIKSDEKVGGEMAGAAGAVANLLSQLSSRSNKRTAGIEGSDQPPALDRTVPDPTLVPGETDVNPGQLTYDSFTRGQMGSHS